MQIFWCLITGLALHVCVFPHGAKSLTPNFLQNLWELGICETSTVLSHLVAWDHSFDISETNEKWVAWGGGLVASHQAGKAEDWGKTDEPRSPLPNKTNQATSSQFLGKAPVSQRCNLNLLQLCFFEVWLFASHLCYCCLLQPWAGHLLFSSICKTEKWFLLLKMLRFTYLLWKFFHFPSVQ